ncbi:MAG: hypothetical protein FD161_1732 [Limisphaerales bacterium]|nr:MAG: hypothetical protein FD161_1732 [Limisphaerales bacterium]KAG0509168.1 MAG: hypothetical protein E1N63_1651 [Limisphaerales bacterium]TXT52492.1 MAG: hypothetical protein FD140_716 [Limisphaerales bacterium]
MSTKTKRKRKSRQTRGAVKKLGVFLQGGRSFTVRLFTKTKRGPELQFREKWSRSPSVLSLAEAVGIAERLQFGLLPLGSETSDLHQNGRNP